MNRLTKLSIADNGYIIKEMDGGCDEWSCNEICAFYDCDCRKCPLQKALNKLGRIEDKKETDTKAYRIYWRERFGLIDEEGKFARTYNKAVQFFNDRIRKVCKEVYDQIDDMDFSEEVQDFKKEYMDIEIICRAKPFIIFKDKNGDIVARIFSYGKPDPEYGDTDIKEEEVILHEINLE